MITWEQAVAKSQQLHKRRLELLGKKQAIEEQRQTALNDLTQAQERVMATDFVREILDNLQKKEHERAVGAYEQLLGAFLSDVLPGERQIVMDLHADRGAPALDIFIKKGEHQPLEDAWLGTGGSVTNLLSTGLRLVALLRSGQRRFLVLDESDCWIKPDLIPKYAAIVSQMSRELGVQVLMISHHDESLFAQHIPHRLKLSKLGSGLLQADWSPSSDIPAWQPEQGGIRSIAIKDFQSHQHTTVPLSYDVTLLQGDNDIGKSAVVNALRAVFDGDSNDTLIRHHAASAQVFIDFGPDHYLSWQRFRKGKVKVSYKLIDPSSGETLHASDGTKVPEWVQADMKIGKIEGLDVQIGQQQDPVFLLNQTASIRAKALAIGQESGHVNQMMLFDKQEVQDAKTVVKYSEKILEKTRHQIEVLANLGESNLSETLEHIQQRALLLNKSQLFWDKWNQAYQTTILLTQLGPKPHLATPREQHPPAQALCLRWARAFMQERILRTLGTFTATHMPVARTEGMLGLVEKWTTSTIQERILQRLGPAPTLALPQERQDEQRLVGRWSKSAQIFDVLNTLADRAPPVAPTTLTHNGTQQHIHALIGTWRNARHQQSTTQQEFGIAQQEETQAQEALNNIDACPTCGQHWPHNKHGTH